MSQQPADGLQNIAMRVVELESLHMHLQRTVEDLNQVVLAQQNRLDALERAVGALRESADELANARQEVRRPEDEKPPHY